MNDSRFVFGIGLQSNKESNEFLRCLWSRIAASFGKLAWQYNPIKVNNTIFVGQGCISEDILLNVRLGFKKRGCLAFIDFSPSGSFDANTLHSKLKQCVNEALNYKDYEREVTGTGLMDKNLSFIKKEGHTFRVEGNRLTLRVRGYDDADCSCMFKAQIQQICNLLTFDTLKYITLSGTLTEEMRNNHNFITRLINEDDGESDSMERNEMYRNLEVSDKMAQYLDSYLERSFDYENHFSNFDKCVQLFAQGVRNEELSRLYIGLPEPYVELAIVNYMSALEVITLNDREPVQCDSCGQTKYSIARRVIDLMKSTIPGGDTFAKRFYNDRSKYVHTGSLLSSNNYINRSIPLMSISSKSGMIEQISRIDFNLKEVVKECIEKHEDGIESFQS